MRRRPGLQWNAWCALALVVVVPGVMPWQVHLAADPPIAILEGFVVSIYSGDQFMMVNSLDNKNHKVRLEGVDAPEPGQPFFDEAREALSEKVIARRVRVECTSGERMKGGYVGRVKLDGQPRMINNIMLEEGWGWYAEATVKSPRLAELQAAAKEDQRGLWALKDPIAPWEFAANQPVAVARRLGRKRESAKETLDSLASATEGGGSDEPARPPRGATSDKNVPQEALAAYVKLLKEWQVKVAAWMQKIQKSEEANNLVAALKMGDFGPEFSKKFLELAKTYPKNIVALECLGMSIHNGNLGKPDMAVLKEAGDLMVADYKDHPGLPAYLFNLRRLYTEEPAKLGQDILRRVLDESQIRDNQGSACYALAGALWEEGMPTEGEDEVIALLERVRTEFKAVDLGVFKLGDAAEENLYFIRNLTMGKVAPDITGKDLDGQEMALSDFRGKVVVVDFWGDWCPFCRQMYPQHRQLVEEHASRPFALLGVNNDKNKSRLREACERENISWRNWTDNSGRIAEKYMVDGYPTMYVLDAEGKIRGRFSGVPGKALEKLIGELLSEQEGGGPQQPAETPAEEPATETPAS